MSLYIPDKIEEIITAMTINGTIASITESGVYSLLNCNLTEIEDLQTGMIITINNINYQIVDITSNIIKIEANNIDTETDWSLAVNFLYGHRPEIQEILENKSNNHDTKFLNFPLIWLNLDIEEQKNTSTLVASEADIILVFAYRTKKEYRAATRLTDNFKLVLQPLLDLFIEKLNHAEFNPMFVKEFGETIDYKKVDRYFYGSNDKNKSVFKTLTDAIEIQVSLKFRKTFSNCN